MSSIIWVWSIIWSILLLAFLFILYKSENKKLYLMYFVFGMVFGFYFDIFSVTFGYYSYGDLFIKIADVPLSMTAAEGFAVAITIGLYNFVRDFFTVR